MSQNISINIEGDLNVIKSSFSNLNQILNKTKEKLISVNQSMKLDFKPIVVTVAKFYLLNNVISITNKKLISLKQLGQSVKKTFGKNLFSVEICQSFRNCISSITGELNNLKITGKDVQESLSQTKGAKNNSSGNEDEGSNCLDNVNSVLSIASSSIDIIDVFSDGKGSKTASKIGEDIGLAVRGFGDLAANISEVTIALGEQAIVWAVNKAEIVQHKIATVALTVAEKVQTVVQGALNAVMSMNPIALIVIAIVAVIAGLVLLWNKCEGFRKFVHNLLGVIKKIWSNLIDGAVNAWEGIKSVFSKVIGWFKNIFKKAWQGVKNVFSAGGKVFSGIKEGIGSAFKSVVNVLIRGINKVISVPFSIIKKALDKIRNIKIFGKQPFSFIPKVKIPKIPQLEMGGVLKRGQIGLLEGNGAEAVVPLERNTFWINKIAEKFNAVANRKMGNNQDYYVARKISSLEENQNNMIDMFEQYFPQFIKALDLNVTLDDKTLVGKLAPQIDNELGKRYRMKERMSL